MNKSNVIKGNLCALYSTLVWGTTFIVTKNLMGSFNAAEILFTRFVVAFIVLMFIRLIKGKEELPAEKNKKDELLLALCGLTGLFLYGTLEIISMKYTYASNTSTIVSTNPFFIALFAILFLKEEKPRVNFFGGFVIAISGVALISFNGSAKFGLNPFGDFLALLCAVAWGVYTTLIKKLSNKGYSTTYVTRHTYLWGCVVMALALPFFGINTDFTRFTDTKSLLSLLFLGVIASCTCFLTWNYATRAIGPVNSGIYIYAIPVVTIVFAAIVLHESVNILSFAGIALVVAGTVISSIRKGDGKNERA
ncbi:MAG: DMT family transporter [Clostridia bacterium]|nr:DMT family transporter [Clostridia bacterium]